MTRPGWFEWTTERVTRVMEIAARGGTAREACEAVGIEPEREHLVYRLAKQRGFKFRNVGRKRNDTRLYINIDELTSHELTARARQHNRPRRDLAARLLAIVLAQGPTFIDNLLSEDT
jgi:hypothetical protein